ncbi:MAG: sulfotransferase [Gemmatimonadota bacterium]|nr:sulfotransferase [Gemmatimonadota bacterium]
MADAWTLYPRSALERARIGLDLIRTWVRVGPASRRGADRFDEVEAYCFFIGYPRSGTSLLGSLLDAHPDAVIAREMDAIRYVNARFDRARLFHLLEENASREAASGRRHTASGYAYPVPGQWQGRHRTLRVIGDKQAAGSTIRLAKNPALLDALRRTVGAPLRVIHVVRNPFDVIATMARREAQNGGPDGTTGAPDLERAFLRFETLTATVDRLSTELGDELYPVAHERLVDDPQGELGALCGWLGLSASADYLDACAAIVWTNPQRTRDRVTWPPELARRVDALTADTPRLGGYSFHADRPRRGAREPVV